MTDNETIPVEQLDPAIPPAQPPGDNDHVAEGATPFTAEEIAANATEVVVRDYKHMVATLESDFAAGMQALRDEKVSVGIDSGDLAKINALEASIRTKLADLKRLV